MKIIANKIKRCILREELDLLTLRNAANKLYIGFPFYYIFYEKNLSLPLSDVCLDLSGCSVLWIPRASVQLEDMPVLNIFIVLRFITSDPFESVCSILKEQMILGKIVFHYYPKILFA